MNSANAKQHPKALIDALLSKCDNEEFKQPKFLSNDISNRLLMERHKACEILQNSQRQIENDNSVYQNKFYTTDQKITSKSPGHLTENYFKRTNKSSFNISDLITDETIHLEGGDSQFLRDSSLKTRKDIKLSFEPNEMTGRSTLGASELKAGLIAHQRSSSNAQQVRQMSVSDILASSFAPKARDLCETLNLEDTVCADTSSWIASAGNNDFDNLSACFDTDDDKLSKKHESIETAFSNFIISTPNNCSFGNSNASIFKGSPNKNIDSLSEEFQPGELMHSKLINDEISWAQKYAAIPTKVLSQEAKIKYEKSNAKSGEWDGNNTLSKCVTNNNHADLSVGAFFQLRSDNLHNIIEQNNSNNAQALNSNKNLLSSLSEEVISSDLSKKKKSLNENIDNKNDLKKKTVYQSAVKSKNDVGSNLCTLHLNTTNFKGNKEDTNNSTLNRSENTLVDSNRLNTSKTKLSKDNVKKNSLKEEINQDNKENIDPNFGSYWNSVNASDPNSYNTSSNSSRNSVLEVKRPSPIKSNVMKTKVNLNDDDKYETPKRKHFLRHKVANGSTFTLSEISATSTQCAEKHRDSKTNNSVISTLRTRNRQCEINTQPLEMPKLIQSLNDQTLTNSTKSDYNVGIYQHSLENTINKKPYITKSSTLCSNKSNNKTTRTAHGKDSEIIKESSSAAIMPKKCVNMKTPSKENNCNSYNSTVKRVISSSSTSSEYRQHHGIQLPIKVTACSLSWPSAKLREDTHKSMQIKNISNKRLNFRMVISGPGFQFVPSTQRGNVMTLHGQECRSITVSFCPTVQGVAIGKISIYENSINIDTSILDISLFGIGGEAKVRVDGILQGPIGTPFLPMGSYSDLAHPIERTFTIRNKGNLPGFFIATINALDLTTPPDYCCTKIHPSRCIIMPNESITIYVRFRPKRDLIKKVIKRSNEVITLAVMHIILGDEYDRQRICRMLRHQSNSEKIPEIVLMLLEKFPNEVSTDDLAQFKEEQEIVNDLLSSFGIYAVALTLNNNLMLDETMVSSASMFAADAEETAYFRTICYDPETDMNLIESPPSTTSLSSIVAGELTLSPLSVSIKSPRKVN